MSLRRFKKIMKLPVSPSPDRPQPGFEFGPDGLQRRIMTRTPDPPTPRQRELMNEIIRLEQVEEEAVTSIIEQINMNLGIDVDQYDKTIRWIISKIISVHGLTKDTAKRIQRCKPLLYAISNAVATNTTTAGLALADKARMLLPIANELTIKAASLAGRGLLMGASMAKRGLVTSASMASYHFSRGMDFLTSRQSGELEGRRDRSRSPPRARSISPGAYSRLPDIREDEAQESYFVIETLSKLYSALYEVLNRVSTILAPCGGSVIASLASRGFEKVRAMCSMPQQAVGAAVNQVVPEGPNLECSICMDNAISGQGAVLTRCNHRFHRNCIEEWFRRSGNNSCPYCRSIVRELSPPQSQSGGSKKYKSKTRTKSKSKSKTRRLRKSRKPRKSYKSIKPRSSSRRK